MRPARCRRDRFYKGDIARRWWLFSATPGALRVRRLRGIFAKVEEPAVTSYRGMRSTSTRLAARSGPARSANILEQFDLSMKRNSADYIHTLVEALKLARGSRLLLR